MRRSKRTKKHRPVKKVQPSKINTNALAWQFARVMGKVPVDKTNCNHKVFCPSCSMMYCLGADMVDQFCEGEVKCFYFPCPKEQKGRRVCQHCGGVS